MDLIMSASEVANKTRQGNAPDDKKDRLRGQPGPVFQGIGIG